MATKIFGYTDIHWSDRDKTALAVAEAAQRAFKPDVAVIGGDLLNCGPFSRHPARKLDEDDGYDYISTELEPARQFLDRVQRHAKRTVMLEGNHDEWFERWMTGWRDRQIFGSLAPSRYLSADRRDFSYVPFTKLGANRLGGVRLGPRLIAVHGWAAQKYAADRHLQMAKPYSIIYHHTHRADHRRATMCDGKLVEALCAGCLCRTIPIYAHNGNPTEWTHGFWVAYVGSRSHTIYSVAIERGAAVMPNGKEVRS